VTDEVRRLLFYRHDGGRDVSGPDIETFNESAAAEFVEIPSSELSAVALNGVIEAFVLREGTDYGAREFSLAEKVAAVRNQLERREARIVYDPATRSVDIQVRARPAVDR
jgi:uncharacterized protein YheU (UPF0270 family)